MNKVVIEPVSSGQFFWMVVISVVAGGIYFWPETVIRDAGADALWAIGLAIVMAFAISLLQVAWAQQVPGRGYADRLRETWGELAWFWLSGTFAICVAVDVLLLSLFSSMLHVFFLPETSPFYTSLLILAIAAWLSGQSLAVIARNVQFWMPLILASFVLAMSLISTSMHPLDALRPVWPPNFADLPCGLWATWYLWDQGGITITVLGHVRSPTWPALRRWLMGAMSLQAAVVMLVWGAVVTTLGPWAAETLQWPFIYIMINLTPLAFFIARVGVFIIPTWSVAIILYLAMRLFCGSFNLQLLTGASNPTRVGIVWGTATVIAVLTRLIATPADAVQLLVGIVDPLAFVWALLQFSLSYVFARWVKRAPFLPTSESKAKT